MLLLYLTHIGSLGGLRNLHHDAWSGLTIPVSDHTHSCYNEKRRRDHDHCRFAARGMILAASRGCINRRHFSHFNHHASLGKLTWWGFSFSAFDWHAFLLSSLSRYGISLALPQNVLRGFLISPYTTSYVLFLSTTDLIMAHFTKGFSSIYGNEGVLDGAFSFIWDTSGTIDASFAFRSSHEAMRRDYPWQVIISLLH